MLRAEVVQEPGWRMAEVGVFLGDLSAFMLSLEPAELHLIDPFEGQLVSGNRDGDSIRTCHGNDAIEYVRRRFEGDNRVFIHRAWSPPGLLQFYRWYFDLVYLDGSHTYEDVKKDLAAALTRVKPGGFICGHDYGANPKKCPFPYTFGVRRAVDEFCKDNDLQVSHLANDGYISFAIQLPPCRANKEVDVCLLEGNHCWPWVLIRRSEALRGIGKANELGLFAARPMPAGTVIGRYMGFLLGKSGNREVEREAKVLEAAGKAAYLLTIRGIIVDGSRPPQSDVEQLAVAGEVLFPADEYEYPGAHMHMMNDGYRTPYPNNVKIDSDGFAITKVDVPAYNPKGSREAKGLSELLWDYRESYWELMDSLLAANKRRKGDEARNERRAKRARN
ncbi:hypothetical protein KFL_007380040 [Klebsormidium nitens]|uniref:Class I SAM-dependent methyltransferase n=1 Tax=Klebsormidium nitens TaxID=105231 RepID=A0A1Y1INV4_KLENI|nr:hypothetical protein KFL_007380040 [Klebsormidium nitens]|eukprot:GAQ91169.1 hypothetical protein KFL_007380040 [Klebsormidium nitens]